MNGRNSSFSMITIIIDWIWNKDLSLLQPGSQWDKQTYSGLTQNKLVSKLINKYLEITYYIKKTDYPPGFIQKNLACSAGFICKNLACCAQKPCVRRKPTLPHLT